MRIHRNDKTENIAEKVDKVGRTRQALLQPSASTASEQSASPPKASSYILADWLP